MSRLVHTEKALAEYDAFMIEFDAAMNVAQTDGKVYKLMNDWRRMGRRVGEAYGRDTADFNDLDTCRACVRPGAWLRRQIEYAQGAEAGEGIARFFFGVLNAG